MLCCCTILLLTSLQGDQYNLLSKLVLAFLLNIIKIVVIVVGVISIIIEEIVPTLLLFFVFL
jgi:hypothetical protein